MSEAIREEAEIRERFEVDNDMKAEWCLKKIARIRQEQNREKEELTRQMDFYRQQMETVDQKADSDVAYFENILRGYFNSRVEAGFSKESKTKVSYKLPSGNLVLKHQEPEYERDDALVIGWLKQNGGQFIKVKESLDWAALKKTVKASGNVVVNEDGEIIPGITVVEREDTFSVEVK